MKKQELVNIAKELSNIMELEPRIKVVGVSNDAIMEKVKEAAGFIDLEVDTFSKETETGLKEMGFWPGEDIGEVAEDKGEDKIKEKDVKKLPNQTTSIRTWLKSKKSKEAIITLLASTFKNSEGWATSRFNLYEKAYGKMGVADKKIK